MSKNMGFTFDDESLFKFSEITLGKIKSVKDIFDLSGKVAVVTGTVGLAFNVINRLAECGAKVVAGGRNEYWGKRLVDTMTARGYEVAYKQTDVRKVEDCDALVAFAEEKYGPVDIAVPVAGIWAMRAVVDMDEDFWNNIIDTDLKGCYFFVKAAARSMIKAKKGGKIVTVSSTAWRAEETKGVGLMSAYCAAKGGVVSSTKAIAKELRQYGIIVNSVAPGSMMTPGVFYSQNDSYKKYGPELQAEMQKYGEGAPISRTPDEVALVVLAMCTGISDFMCGQTLDVDGGSQYSFTQSPWSYTMDAQPLVEELDPFYVEMFAASGK